jgi:hypothetical protein
MLKGSSTFGPYGEDLPDRITIKNQSHRLTDGDAMAELDKGKPVSPGERVVSILAMTDALAKLLIEKGVITTPSSRRSAAGARGISAHSESHGTVTSDALRVTRCKTHALPARR